KTAGTAPGSIIAAIIHTHRGTKNANEPSSVATPMSIPFICRTATTHAPAASPSVSAAAAAADLPLVMAAERGAGDPRQLGGVPLAGRRPGRALRATGPGHQNRLSATLTMMAISVSVISSNRTVATV